MSLQAALKAKIPTWPEDMSRSCSPWRTAQTSLAGIDSWYAREEEAFAAANPSAEVEDKMSSPQWEEAGMAALSAQRYRRNCDPF